MDKIEAPIQCFFFLENCLVSRRKCKEIPRIYRYSAHYFFPTGTGQLVNMISKESIKCNTQSDPDN